ncbi:hypothetical protein [Kribbella sp. CA-294648]|uniref:hypothetical protein n=1 Tax=Kribbella sp. CA-294648 TaxID=3239948 RepID=UPI003D934D45
MPTPDTPPATELTPRPATALRPRPEHRLPSHSRLDLSPHPNPSPGRQRPARCRPSNNRSEKPSFDTLFTEAVTTINRSTPTTLDLTLTSTAEPTARDLTTREVSCCNFFTFTYHPAFNNTLVLRIAVPQSTTYIAILNAVEARARHQLTTRPPVA